jgi:hypothetical protein
MKMGRLLGLVLGCALLGGLAGREDAFAGGEPPGKGESDMLVVVDNAGKEHKLKTWKFESGVRRLSWLAAAKETPGKKGKPAVKGPAGPEALEFSEGTQPPLKKRVLTLVPLESIRAINFDTKKKRVTVHVVHSDKADDDEVLTGLTGYVGVNHLSLTAEADLGDLGMAKKKFQGGVSKGIRSIRFPAPKPVAAVGEGRPAKVAAGSQGKTIHQIVDLQPLYRFGDGGARLHPTLYFEKTVKIEVDTIAKLTRVGSGEAGGLTFDVLLKDGKQNPLILIDKIGSLDGRPAQLEGLVGRVSAGYKLVPMAGFGEIQFDKDK